MVLAVAASLVFKHLEKPEHRLGKGHAKKTALRKSPAGAHPCFTVSFFFFSCCEPLAAASSDAMGLSLTASPSRA